MMLRVRKEKQRQPLDDFLLALLADDLDGIFAVGIEERR